MGIALGSYYRLVAITLGLILFAGSISGSAPSAFANNDDSHDDSNGDDKEKWLKLLKQWREKNNDHKQCPEEKKYGDICDKQKPKIKITSPRNNERVCAPVMVLGTAEDRKTGIASVIIRVDNGQYMPATYDSITKEFKFTTEELDPGKHRVIAKATDLVGNEKRKSVMFRVLQCDDPSTTSELTINAKSSGEEDPGKWTVLFEGNTWNALQMGYTPITFTVNDNENYRVGVANFGGLNFVEWGSGSTENPRPFSINSDTTFTAFYEVED